jgi:two-component system response regulator AtoC
MNGAMTDERLRVLVADDDAAVRTVLSALLEQGGFATEQASNGNEAFAKLESGDVHVLVTDLRMPGMDGMQLLSRALETRPDVPVIVLTAHGTVALAVDAMRLGAADFVEKPFDRDDVLTAVRTAALKAQKGNAPPPVASARSLLGASPALEAVRTAIGRAAASNATVLIRGENGTGKELVARAVHEASPRARGPFVTINCAALPESLIESEIFGHLKGSFTGATKDKPGRIELADGGTLFFDEIGDYSASLQLKLLRVLQEREVQRLGATEALRVDVRFVAATNQNLALAMERGEFRADLFYRLNVIPINVPPLRARDGDVALLTGHFVRRAAAQNAKPGLGLEPDAVDLLTAQAWPGNVRQLENFIERLVVFADGARITRADVVREIASDGVWLENAGSVPESAVEPQAFNDARAKAERDAIVRALARAGNNRTHAARILNMSRRTLYNKLAEYELI